jgi:predicted nucleic acid-binding protein
MAGYFLDTSALVKHYHAETGTDVVDRIIGEPAAELFITRLTLVETMSAFAIKVRTGQLDVPDFVRLRALLATDVARRRFRVLRLLNAHYDRARSLIGGYGLNQEIRTLDALQLGVALHLHEAAPLDHFVCADQRLCSVALLEGLAVINPEQP